MRMLWHNQWRRAPRSRPWYFNTHGLTGTDPPPPFASFVSSSKDERASTCVFVSTPFPNLAKADGKDGALNNHDGNKYHKDSMEKGSTFLNLADEPIKTKASKAFNALSNVYCSVASRTLSLLWGVIGMTRREQPQTKVTFLPYWSCWLNIMKLFRNALGTPGMPRGHQSLEWAHQHHWNTASCLKHWESCVRHHCWWGDRQICKPRGPVCLRFVEMVDGDGLPHIREHFLDFVHLERTTGAKIGAAIMQSLTVTDRCSEHWHQENQRPGVWWGWCNVLIPGWCTDCHQSSCSQGTLRTLQQPPPEFEHCWCLQGRRHPQHDRCSELFFDMSPKRQKFLKRVLKVRCMHSVSESKRWKACARHDGWRGIPATRSSLSCTTTSSLYLKPSWILVPMRRPTGRMWRLQQKQLLCIGCTLSVGSAEAERTFSAFRRLKTYLRSRMSEERLSGLALMHIHHGLHIDVKDICHNYI